MVIGVMNCIDAGVLVIDITLIAYLDLSKLDSDLTINWKFVYRMDEVSKVLKSDFQGLDIK